MPTVIPVKFSYATHELWFDPASSGAHEGDHVICTTARGTEIGLATQDAFEASASELGDKGAQQLQQVVRIATDDDLERADELAREGEQALPTFRRLAHESGLDIKPVGVEYLFGGERIVCYFAAEERVDFRQLVRSLARELQGRIDMRQIGVREEAAIIGGYAQCGQELCCARFGQQFEPVSIRMAKEQDLPLNSSKISGVCGRLMCCLRYEFEAYRDFKSRAPKRNAVITTPLGKAKIVEYDTPKEQLSLRLENGKQLRVNLADMTASDAARTKSKELGCPCRPDTVTREILERMETPEVQMALAEIDRQNGVAVDEGFESADIFVEAKPRRRRSGGQKAGEQGAQQHKEATNQKPRRRRRNRASEPAAEKQVGEDQSTKKPRRTHKRRPGDHGGQENHSTQPHGGSAKDTKDASSSQGQAPRRRHRSRRNHKSDDSSNKPPTTE